VGFVVDKVVLRLDFSPGSSVFLVNIIPPWLFVSYTSLSQSFYPGGTLEIIFRSQGTPA
jgi:hypothetical protein